MADCNLCRARNSAFMDSSSSICSSRSRAVRPSGGCKLGTGVGPAWNGVAETPAPRYPPVSCTGEEGRPMFTKVGKFRFSEPSAEETQAPKEG